MNVILLTVFIGLILVSMAIVFFFYTRMASQGSSPERDSLLPLQEDLNETKNENEQASENQ